MSDSPLVEQALAIAAKDLRWCYRQRGIISGSRMVYWSWDSFFASLGSLCLGDTEIVKRNLELYLHYQNQAGSIPKRIAHPLYWMQYIGLRLSRDESRQRPTFWNSYFTSPSIAQNPTFIIAFHEYVTTKHNQDFFLRHQGKLERIMEYLTSREGELGLLSEGVGGGWAESVLKRGAIAFTNMCYARSIQCMAELHEMVGDLEVAANYRAKYQEVKRTINEFLWSDEQGGFYSDWYSQRRHHHFATDGNLLAIWWDIATPEQAKKIQSKIDELSLEDDIPIRLAYDPYDFWRVYIFLRIGGIKDYHVGFCWSWLGCIDALVKLKMGDRAAAQKILEKIAAVIVRDGTVHEIYDKGKAVHTPLYKSEHPWAWGAGLFVKACHDLGYRLT